MDDMDAVPVREDVFWADGLALGGEPEGTGAMEGGGVTDVSAEEDVHRSLVVWVM